MCKRSNWTTAAESNRYSLSGTTRNITPNVNASKRGLKLRPSCPVAVAKADKRARVVGDYTVPPTPSKNSQPRRPFSDAIPGFGVNRRLGSHISEEWDAILARGHLNVK